MQSWFANVKMRNYEANSVFDVHIHLSLYIMSATVTCESLHVCLFVCLYRACGVRTTMQLLIKTIEPFMVVTFFFRIISVQSLIFNHKIIFYKLNELPTGQSVNEIINTYCRSERWI